MIHERLVKKVLRTGCTESALTSTVRVQDRWVRLSPRCVYDEEGVCKRTSKVSLGRYLTMSLTLRLVSSRPTSHPLPVVEQGV